MHMLEHPKSDACADARSGFALPSLDALGIFASALCLVHCLLLPFAIMLVPALGGSILHDDRAHYFLAFFVTTFCLFAIVPGYVRHSNKRVLLLMVSGLTLVLFATFASVGIFGEASEIPIITVGNLLVVAAHWFNRRLLACC